MTEMPPHLAAKDEDKNNSDVESDSSDVDDRDLPLVYDNPWDTEPIKAPDRVEHSWRVKEKYKTHCVALVLCLNVGVDPPDVVKTQPCARLECWIDPLSLSPTKALESIGHALQTQYERWQPRARYKQSLDPTSEEVKKLCCSLRRNAKDERVLFHYNGHGVPKPTAQGEIWVFNRTYTQYIPLSMYDLQTWMGAPSLYVYDCSNAGVIVDNFKLFADQHERDYETQMKARPEGSTGAQPTCVSYKNCIQLAACAAGQSLPMTPDLPADLFTACLTTPVKMAMKWFVLRTKTRVTPHNVHDLIDKIPGQVTDRRTMLGELNWIFTAITDTIAWSSLPPELFQQLFRADLLTASLCRNFLLADRIMRSYNCTPVSMPALPSLARHPLWQAWEQTLDLALAQLPAMLGSRNAPYQHSPFFRDQLTAFQVWLDLGCVVRAMPEQLPMVLQVLLSTLHRVRALQLLCRFLALGTAPVKAVLHVGIFPYMLKLLQASAHDLRPSMVYIWAKIIAVDPSCQVDLVNAKGHKYFLSVLQDTTVDAEHRTLAAFVLAGIVDNYPAGQEAALQGSMISICLEGVWCSEAALRMWATVALGHAWRQRAGARLAAARDLAHEKLAPLLQHPAVPVRAAAAFALGTYMGSGCGGARTEHANAIDQQLAVTLAAALATDCAYIVRAEILAALQWPVLIYEQHFIAVYIQERMRRSDKESGSGGRVDAGQDALGHEHARRHGPALCLPTIGFGSVYMKIWNTLCAMSKEPHPQISQMASDIINYIANQVDNVSREVEGVSRGSSLPGSPRPASHMNSLGHRRGKSGLPNTISEESVISRDRDSTSSSSSGAGAGKRGIVRTNWVAWVSRRVAAADAGGGGAPGARGGGGAPGAREAGRPRRTPRPVAPARPPRLDTQAFHSRCALPPVVLLFHPYEQHIAVANKDNFGIWDWGTAAKLWAGSWTRAWGRVTSLQFLNAHQRPLLAAASHSGCVAVYRAEGEGRLVTSWRALHTRVTRDTRPPHAMPLYSGSPGPGSADTARGGVLLRWSPARASLAVAGPADSIALWDLNTHMLHATLSTESSAMVTSLWRDNTQLIAGLSDGSVRLYDERTNGAVLTLRDHTQPVLLAERAPHLQTLATASAEGSVRLYDARVLRARAAVRAPPPLGAAALHARADLLACGSINQSISMYDLKGNALNTIKFHEGFMGARIGPVSCLTFHPHRVAMGVGSKDSTVSVYVSEPRR